MRILQLGGWRWWWLLYDQLLIRAMNIENARFAADRKYSGLSRNL